MSKIFKVELHNGSIVTVEADDIEIGENVAVDVKNENGTVTEVCGDVVDIIDVTEPNC